MTQVFHNAGMDAGYCQKCQKGYAIGPHVCPTEQVPSKKLVVVDGELKPGDIDAPRLVLIRKLNSRGEPVGDFAYVAYWATDGNPAEQDAHAELIAAAVNGWQPLHDEIERLQRQVDTLSVHASKWVTRALELQGSAPEPCDAPYAGKPKEHARDVHYQLIEGFGLRDTPMANFAVRQLLETLATSHAQSPPASAQRPPIIDELRAVDNRADFAQIYLRHLCLRAADELERATQPPADVRSMRVLLEDAERIVTDFARKNPRWKDTTGLTQDPWGAHAWLERYSGLTKEAAPEETLCPCDAPYREGFECMHPHIQARYRCRRLESTKGEAP